jgi:hypothetical protein
MLVVDKEVYEHWSSCFEQLQLWYEVLDVTKTKLRGFSPQANYTERATTACRGS